MPILGFRVRLVPVHVGCFGFKGSGSGLGSQSGLGFRFGIRVRV